MSRERIQELTRIPTHFIVDVDLMKKRDMPFIMGCTMCMDGSKPPDAISNMEGCVMDGSQRMVRKQRREGSNVAKDILIICVCLAGRGHPHVRNPNCHNKVHEILEKLLLSCGFIPPEPYHVIGK
jgi:hypothetical protein